MILASTSMLLAMVLAVSPVDVRSATNCPSTEEVNERLLPLLPAVAGAAEDPDVAHLEVGEVQAGGAMELHLRLVRADASVIGDRHLLMQGTCRDMAEAVATVVAAWETKPLPGAIANTVSTPAAKSTVSAGTLATTPSPLLLQPLQILVGAGGGAALVGGVAAAGSIDLQVGRSASHWRWRFGVVSQRARRLDLSDGHVDWQHTNAALGVCWRLLDPAWLLTLDAGPMAGWATLSGQGFSIDRQQHAFEFGATAGLRAGRNFGRIAVWAEWRTSLWAQGQRATVTGAQDGVDLRQVDTTAGLGFSVLLIE